MSKNYSPHLALHIMMKDEQDRLHVTLESVKEHVDSIVAYDTGSTDNTIQILETFCKKNNIILRLKQGTFVDFSTSRNISLDWADTFEDIDFMLLMDVNDELRGGKILREYLKKEINSEHPAYLTCQHWWSGKYDKYFNIRLVKAREGWRYKGSVHEWMTDTKITPNRKVCRMPDNIVLYQDRTKDGNKSAKRFVRDKELLLTDHKKDPKEPRTVFYLAQTCSCLKQSEDAFYYYRLRSQLEGFQEEKYHAYVRCGNLAKKLDQSWSDVLSYYMKAIEHSPDRAEAYIKVAQHYQIINKWFLSYMFVHQACSLKYPERCILFVDKHCYDYTRWHILGIVAYYCKFYKEGKDACKKAIAAGLNIKLDKNNLKFYEQKLAQTCINNIKSIGGDTDKEFENNKNSLTKKEFIYQMISKLKSQNPNMKPKIIQKKALNAWKKRNK